MAHHVTNNAHFSLQVKRPFLSLKEPPRWAKPAGTQQAQSSPTPSAGSHDDDHDRHHCHDNLDFDNDQIHDHDQEDHDHDDDVDVRCLIAQPQNYSPGSTTLKGPPSDDDSPQAASLVRIFRAAALVTARKTPTDGDDIKTSEGGSFGQIANWLRSFFEIMKVEERKA
jgi:uncharacterized protein involved in copper resistance